MVISDNAYCHLAHIYHALNEYMRKNIIAEILLKVTLNTITHRHIRIEINHGSIRKPMLKLKTHSGFHDLILNLKIEKKTSLYLICIIYVKIIPETHAHYI
jgi:hypothetical protein